MVSSPEGLRLVSAAYLDELLKQIAKLEARTVLTHGAADKIIDEYPALRARIAELEALLSQTNTYYVECIAAREELRMALGQSIKQYQYLLMKYEPEKAAAMAHKAMGD